ncbi:hypothetical protein Sjap_000617 [Stephania japonica]|uniref:Cullin N-terminal domain-containing protein n=1 Tax=Stephania japonica TaxID=461633 RepID=A0AAP0KKS1_9MAGN
MMMLGMIKQGIGSSGCGVLNKVLMVLIVKHHDREFVVVAAVESKSLALRMITVRVWISDRGRVLERLGDRTIRKGNYELRYVFTALSLQSEFSAAAVVVIVVAVVVLVVVRVRVLMGFGVVVGFGSESAIELCGIGSEFRVGGLLECAEMAITDRETIDWEQGWEVMQKGITKLNKILVGLPEPQFTLEENMTLYTTVYNMSRQGNPHHNYSRQLYCKYKETLVEYISTVYKEIKVKVGGVVISLIDQEREGKQIDQELLKNVLDIFAEIGMGDMNFYENDFEVAMLCHTSGYYSRKASNWILEDSCPAYMKKVEDCLKREKDRVSHYLHSSSEQKLLREVQNELLVVYASQLLEKEHSGCHALLRDSKVEDLSMMYRLFSQIPHGLNLVSNIFKQHVTTEFTTLVKQTEDAASNEKAEKKEMVGLQEQVFVRKVIDLHDKYSAYVTNCFMNDTLFDKALREAFEVFCNKTVGGSSSAEQLATYCDNIFKKRGSEKLSDKAIEETCVKLINIFNFRIAATGSAKQHIGRLLDVLVGSLCQARLPRNDFLLTCSCMMQST